MTTPLGLRLRLFGAFALTIDGAEPRQIRISAPRHRALLAYLALQPRHAETRERLATLLWGQSTDHHARHSLRQSLSSVRKDLEAEGLDVLTTDRQTVRLDAGRLSIDALEFATLASSGAAADLERAAALYQGDLLDGLGLEVDGFDSWLKQERSRFRTVAARVFERCIDAREDGGNADGAIAVAECLVALDPPNEIAQRKLIELLARHRGRTAALAQAEKTRRLVREEFDSDLEPETAELLEKLKASAALVRTTEQRTDPASGIQLPAPPIDDASARSAVENNGIAIPSEPETELPARAPQPRRFIPRRIWQPTLALLAGVGVIFAYAMLQVPRQVASNDAAAAYPPDHGWRSPNTVLPGAAAVSRAVEGRGTSALLVLPFAAAPADSAPTSRMAGLLSNDLINDLSRVPSLRVIARSTSLQYAKPPVDVAALGKELGVQYVVEGDVRLDDQKVRINVALIDTRTRLHVWTQRYERDDTDRIQVQDEIVRAIARQLHVGVMEVRGRGPANATIDSMLGKGWAALNQFAFFRGGHESGQFFQDVLALDPKNVSALTGLGAFKSVAYNTRQTSEDRDLRPRDGESLLRQAQSLDPNASLPLYFLGRNAMWRGAADEALDYFARTLKLNPSHAPSYGSIGYVLLHTNRLQDAVDNLMYAIRLSPKDHYLGLWSAHVGRAHFELGDFADAERWLTQAVNLMPNSPMNQTALAAFHFYRGDVAAADRQIIELKKLGPVPSSADLVLRFTVLCKHEGDRPQRLLSGLSMVMASARAAQ